MEVCWYLCMLLMLEFFWWLGYRWLIKVISGIQLVDSMFIILFAPSRKPLLVFKVLFACKVDEFGSCGDIGILVACRDSVLRAPAPVDSCWLANIRGC